MNLRNAVLMGALLGAAGVALGAYYAHGFETRLEKQGLPEETIAKRVSQGEVGVRYQSVHAVALLCVGLLASRQSSAWLSVTGCCFVVGVFLFSGGLYLISLDAPKPLTHWAIVPLGGLTLIVGWCSLVVHALRMKIAG